MSTPGNSETYLVCKGFKGIDEDLKLTLLSFTGTEWPKSQDGCMLALLPETSLPDSFLQEMARASDYFGRLQAGKYVLVWIA